MKDIVVQYINKGRQHWRKLSARTKMIMIGAAAMVCFAAVFISLQAKPDFVPLYSNLSEAETGQIQESLDSKGVSSKISKKGTTIRVPEDKVDRLKVELASEGIPESGQIDYSFFGDNAGFGMTDKEFDVMNKAAMQNELGNLVAGIQGIKTAKVMLTLPKDSVWVSDDKQKASASVVLKRETGSQLKQQDVESLYHLISKSVPDLPVDNIVIMDEMFNHFDFKGENSGNSALSTYEQNREVKQGIEKDIRDQVQRMLGMMMGKDKVVVSVSADIDFTKETSKKELVEPVDEESMEGVQVSAERIRESYSGKGNQSGGVPGTGDEDVPGYVEENGGDGGDYQRNEQRINNEFNRIHKEIAKNPYALRDLGIQVMVEPPDPKNRSSLSEARLNDIKNILNTVVRTTLPPKEEEDITDQEMNNKVSLSVQPFNGRMNVASPEKKTLPLWLYIAGAGLLFVIFFLIFLLFRKKGKEEKTEENLTDMSSKWVTSMEERPKEDNQTEENNYRRQLEKMADEKPEEFAKLLRSWISEE